MNIASPTQLLPAPSSDNQLTTMAGAFSIKARKREGRNEQSKLSGKKIRHKSIHAIVVEWYSMISC